MVGTMGKLRKLFRNNGGGGGGADLPDKGKCDVLQMETSCAKPQLRSPVFQRHRRWSSVHAKKRSGETITHHHPHPEKSRVVSNGVSEKACAVGKNVAKKAVAVQTMPEPNLLKRELKLAQTGMEAFAIVIRHLVQEYDVFRVPNLRKELQILKIQGIQAALKEMELNGSIKKKEQELMEMERVTSQIHNDMLEKIRESHFADFEKLKEAHKSEMEAMIEFYEEKMKELNEATIQASPEISSSSTKGQLESEISSLSSILELRMAEINALKSENSKFALALRDLPGIKMQLNSAEARIEDLMAQLQAKIAKEHDLRRSNKELGEKLRQEADMKMKLTFHVEELHYKLRCNSLAFKAKTTAFQDGKMASSTPVGKHGGEDFGKKQIKRSRTTNDMNDRQRSSPIVVDPVVMCGLVEKNDSLSYVLVEDASFLNSIPKFEQTPKGGALSHDNACPRYRSRSYSSLDIDESPKSLSSGDKAKSFH